MLKRIPIFWRLSFAFFAIILLVLALCSLFDRCGEALLGEIQFIIITIFVSLILSCGASWVIVRSLIKQPIQKLARSMNRLTEDDSDVYLGEDEKDEFSLLISSFNEMASKLAKSQKELRNNKDFLEGILESTADIIITVNPDGKILTVNSGAEKTLGYSRTEVISKPIEMFFANPRDRQHALAQLEILDNVVNFKTKFVKKDGQIRDVLLTISRLRNRAGEIIATIGISKDITREKQLQTQLIQSQRFAAIGQVFTGLQHSMKNMLNACKGGAYMIRLGLRKDDRKMFEEGWEITSEGIDRLTDMSLDMLKYVKEWKPNLKRVDLSKTLSEIHRLIEKTAKDRGVNCKIRLLPDLPGVECDARMIHTAVMDITSNALDACDWKDYPENESPEVIIGAFADEYDQEFVIEIEDNGCGMTEEVKANIFTPFFSTKSKIGTGLGLSITSRMIEIHDGRINVESVPDIGTRFRIVLPINCLNGIKEKTNGEKSPDNR